jgi:hypothetical protein
MTYYSSDCLTGNRRFLLVCGLNLYFLHQFKPTVDEWTVQQKVFVFSNIEWNLIALYRLWNLH